MSFHIVRDTRTAYQKDIQQVKLGRGGLSPIAVHRPPSTVHRPPSTGSSRPEVVMTSSSKMAAGVGSLNIQGFFCSLLLPVDGGRWTVDGGRWTAIGESPPPAAILDDDVITKLEGLQLAQLSAGKHRNQVNTVNTVNTIQGDTLRPSSWMMTSLWNSLLEEYDVLHCTALKALH